MSSFKIYNYDDFCDELLKAGFSMAGGNADGIYSVIPFSWNNAPEDSTIKWHTGNRETDPWEWRIRVLEERGDIAYSKLFFKKGGYITKDWYPYFFTARRGGLTLKEAYLDGTISRYAKLIYGLIEDYGVLPLHGIKQLGGFTKEHKSKFDSALVELQMKMYITMCGRKQKQTLQGAEYGWASTMFCTVENFFDKSVFDKADKISVNDAIDKITEQIYRLNPSAEEKRIKRFILG